MTLLQRDREKQEEGALLATKIIKLHDAGQGNDTIAEDLKVDLDYVNVIITDYENE